MCIRFQTKVKYMRGQMNPDNPVNEDQAGGSNGNVSSLNGTTVEDWVTNYEVLKQKLKAQKHYFQQIAAVRKENLS